MIFMRIWNYLTGYLVIRVDGLSLEKFINLAVTNGIYLWGINRQSYTSLTACIGISGFRKLHSINRKLHCRIRILEKRGFPFTAYRYRHRKLLIAGMLIFLAILYGFSAFIWSVEVEGNEQVSKETLINELLELGVRPGAFKGRINTLQIENRLVIDIPQLSWANLEIRGSRAILRVAEGVKPPPIINKDIPANIVATKDGIIDKMIVLDGLAKVKVGDTVKKGQLLISGIIEHPETIGLRYVRAMGQVIARTWYEGRDSLRFDDTYRKRTGNTAEIKYFGLGDFRFPYKKDEVPFVEYDMEVTTKGLIRTEVYHEVELIPWKDDINSAKAILARSAEAKAKADMPPGAKIVDKKLKYDIIEGESITAVLYIEVLEDIGMQQDIDVQ